MPDIFDEVDEDLRAERAQRLLKRYSGPIIALGVLIVLAAAGWQAWQWRQRQQDAAAAMRFLQAMSLADTQVPGANRTQALAGFTGLVETAPEGYRTLARLRVAAIKADSGDLRGAAALWDQVAGDSAADPLLRDVANLSWVEHMIDNGDPALVTARLTPLEQADNPLHALAEEQAALLALRQNKPAEARDTLRRLAQDATAPQGVRARAGGLLTQLGG